MEFMALEFKSIPKVFFSHAYESTLPSKWYILYYNNMVEITSIEKGELHIKNLDNGNKNFYKGGSSYVTPHRNSFVETAGLQHRHVTFGFIADDMTQDLDSSMVLNIAASIPDEDKFIAILPEFFEEDENTYINLKINQIIDIMNSGDTFKNLKASAILMDILSFATTCSIEIANKEAAGHRRYNHTFYCQQAMKYIAENIETEINVMDIADSLSVSYGHLSRLFRQQTGQTLIDYINKEKVKKMKEILAAKKSSISEAALSVGISDDKYASRLFKKYTGYTIGAYMKLDGNEQNKDISD